MFALLKLITSTWKKIRGKYRVLTEGYCLFLSVIPEKKIQAVRTSFFQKCASKPYSCKYVICFFYSWEYSAQKEILCQEDAQGRTFSFHFKDLIKCTPLKVWVMVQM